MAKLAKKVKLIMDFDDGFNLSEEASVEDVLKKILATPSSNSTKIKIEFDDESRSEYESDCTSAVGPTVTEAEVEVEVEVEVEEVEKEEEEVLEEDTEVDDNFLYTASNQHNPTLFI
ncbi:hypothetical protein PU629_04165 [Pullulanibacillus sp. KACC 23026]|uniref:hypothetical protein n=1 Tax=Pullulanibacillus sp. KACC 23026 TaxID=3028315 RepID=UPI0023B03B83|nr:hypothetical protein [Pullulanibacillus sp. KACC 23026]WEG13571.1 hypothetical protein PU629_04165 [Pullulanibacillus sp. KACC 23026]